MDYINTMVWEIRHSGKGWSETYEVYFSKTRAEKRLNELLKWKEEHGYKHNFKLVAVQCADSIHTEYDVN